VVPAPVESGAEAAMVSGDAGQDATVEAGPRSESGSVDSAVDSLVDSSTDGSAPEPSLFALDNTRFAFDLYHALTQNDATPNLLFAPYSISLALAMTYAGAGGQTARQMESVLHYELPPARLHEAFKATDLALASRNGQGLTLTLADSLWTEQSTTLLQSFANTLTNDYGAGPHAVDFIGAPDASRMAINQWISSQTAQQIPNLLPPGSVTTDTRVVVTNAIYFDGLWANGQFNAADSHNGPFTRLDGSTAMVGIMSPGGATKLSYAETSDYQAVELAYAGNATSMVLLLPAVGRFGAIESTLSEELYTQLVSALSQTWVVLSMPKFTLQPGAINLAAVLTNLGMSDAFRKGVADFSGMTSAPIGSIYLAQVVHQAFVAVDERGTRATAATAATLGWYGSAWVPDEVDMTINRPFFFFLRDISTGAVLFVGRVTDPSR
jgi:serpin B